MLKMIGKKLFTIVCWKILSILKAKICLLVDLKEKKSDLGWGGGQKKSSENDQLTGHFQVVFFLFF